MRKIFIKVACKSSGITALRSPPPHAKLIPTHVSKSKKPPYTNQNSFGFIAGNINDIDEKKEIEDMGKVPHVANILMRNKEEEIRLAMELMKISK